MAARLLPAVPGGAAAIRVLDTAGPAPPALGLVHHRRVVPGS